MEGPEPHRAGWGMTVASRFSRARPLRKAQGPAWPAKSWLLWPSPELSSRRGCTSNETSISSVVSDPVLHPLLGAM